MAETVLGKGVVWGISTGATATGMGAFLPQSGNYSVEAEMVEIKNGDGETVGTIHYNPKETITLEVIPADATIAAARTANILPLPGALVVVTDAEDTEIAGTGTTSFIFIKGSKSKSNTDVNKLTFEMVRWSSMPSAAIS